MGLMLVFMQLVDRYYVNVSELEFKSSNTPIAPALFSSPVNVIE